MNVERADAPARAAADGPVLERLGRQMREADEPVIDELLDPRLAELLAALAQAKDPDC
jgi:hypothetical protein